ncbi:hypothetical protein KZC51_05830 [Microbacterium sp. SSW1-49]|uniref:Restriction endonuclease n=1 Tax=Microbacterium croceum TaxID=2851645 RepID=A0ABT0FC70_9MICO|nr:hypothetical protein [Microbacterium croceum]MCK2035651.1 hypothetical protein [Microbacterium croceum]
MMSLYARSHRTALRDPEVPPVPSLPPLTRDLFHVAASEFAAELRTTPFPGLYNATDGKAVGTAVEAGFKTYLQQRFDLTVGNAANGLDFPTLNTDLKVTSLSKPQSSCPYRDATQKIYGLGYNLLVIVYVKVDDSEQRAAFLDIKHVVYIDQARTGDYILTTQIRSMVEQLSDGPFGNRESVIDDLDALLEDKNIPLDEVSRRVLAERLVDDVPEQGVLTISNALQWRLAYSRAISTAIAGTIAPEVVDLSA